MSDIAKELGISTVSVSKALNDKEGVSDDLRDKVKNLASRKGYRINTSARSLKMDKQFNVGIMIAEKYILDKEAYYFTVSGEIIRNLDQLGYSGIMEIVTYDNENRGILPRFYNENKVDGIIVLGQMKRDYLRAIEKVSVPIIFFDFYMKQFDVDCIVSDNLFSAYTITNQLIEKNHREIGYVGSIEATSSIQDRFLGYYKSLIEAGISLNPDMIIPDRDELGQFIPLQLPNPLPTAFVCNCDRVAHTLITTLKKLNVRVPEDCSVVGFDNSIFSTISEPRITTVDNNIPSMVETAVKIIVKKIKYPERIYGRVLIQGKIIDRDSTAFFEGGSSS
ncbi:MAG: LacI family transcriptional regulator [Acholeplasmataceae bacterium]|nr:LacI family transcriptional regulator [Acholeplasmataceae bacterium]